ncbi:hypothetical protein D3C73_1184930 [compost metagenome]
MQGAVFTLHISPFQWNVHHIAVAIGNRRHPRAGWGVILPVGGVSIGDDIAGFAGAAGDRSGAGFDHRHVQTGEGSGRQQAGVVADDTVVPTGKPAIVERYAGGAERQQVGKISFTGIDHRHPGVERGVKALDNNLHGTQQRQHNAGCCRVDGDGAAAAGLDVEVDECSVVSQYFQHIIHCTDQQEAIIAFVLVGDREVGL